MTPSFDYADLQCDRNPPAIVWKYECSHDEVTIVRQLYQRRHRHHSSAPLQTLNAEIRKGPLSTMWKIDSR